MWKETENNLKEIQNKSSVLKIDIQLMRSVADVACIKIVYQQNTYTACFISY